MKKVTVNKVFNFTDNSTPGFQYRQHVAEMLGRFMMDEGLINFNFIWDWDADEVQVIAEAIVVERTMADKLAKLINKE